MEVDSPSEPNFLSPQDRILQRLDRLGVPKELLNQLQPGLLSYVKENKSRIGEIVFAILPTDENLLDAFLEAKAENGGGSKGPSMKEQFQESILWLQWLMFECDPRRFLEKLAKESVDQRGVCGVIWGKNDIAYRCRTCENDPTCAICVPCFQNGNHKDHDFSIIYTGGGCCDCGDVTAWKREGFCSKHKGAEQIQPLPEDIANTIAPAFDGLLAYWQSKLVFTQTTLVGKSRTADSNDGCLKVANELTSTVVETLLEFCKLSESLLSFVSKRVYSVVGLLDILVRSERFLCKNVVKRLHELFLKLLGEPTFKYEFAKAFIKYYPEILKEAIKDCNDSVMQKYPLLSTFSVQIFTVPTLTPRLVEEMNLLNMLMGCLGDIFLSCVGEAGHLEVIKWANMYETTVRLIEDIRFVLSHAEVSRYVIHKQPDICRTWVRLLTFVQGMDPQKRETGIHVEEENENMSAHFTMGHSIANLHSRLVDGAFSVEEMQDDVDDSDSVRHAKVGRLSQESSVCSTMGSSSLDGALQVAEVNVDSGSYLPIPSSVSWLIFECLRAIENWLGSNVVSTDPLNFSSQDVCSNNAGNFLALKKTVSRIRKGKSISKVFRTPSARARFNASSELHGRFGNPSGSAMCIDLEGEQSHGTDMDIELTDVTNKGSDENFVEKEYRSESEAFGLLGLSDWPEIIFDVSSQEISVHIPLHRLLTMLLKKALNRCYGEFGDMSATLSVYPSSRCNFDFFGCVLGGCHPLGFSAFLMEHPLRIRVFCAEVRAGMWRKNGDSAIINFEFYRSVQWSEQGLELDLFLLQCCATLALPDLYVERILERFGLSSYLSLNCELSNEEVSNYTHPPPPSSQQLSYPFLLRMLYTLFRRLVDAKYWYEPLLVQEMLTLIIQIVKERRFCGLSTAESLRRELVYKLAIGDATHSQLLKSLPPDLAKNDQLQKILDTIAVYANPSGMKQGKYSLRRSYWEEVDLYHPRWNSRDLQVVEERYLRFCKVSAVMTQSPRWTKVYRPLSEISRIATCGTVFKIIRAVLFYAVFTNNPSLSRAPDMVVITALHLLSLALDICDLQRKSDDQSCNNTSPDRDDCLAVLTFAGEEIDLGAANRRDIWKHQSLLSLLVSLMRLHKKEAPSGYIEAGQSNHSFLIENLLKKFAELSDNCMTKLRTLAPEVVCQLQSNSNSNEQTSGSSSNAEVRKVKARQKQAAILEKMRAAQSKFMESLESSSNEVDSSTVEQDLSSDKHVEEVSVPVCSLCHDPDSKRPISFLVFLQKSRLASFVERGPLLWEQAQSSEKQHLLITRNEASDPYSTTMSSSSDSSSHLAQLVQSAVNEFTHDAQPGEIDSILDFIKARLPAARNIQRPSTSSDTRVTTPSSIMMLEDDIYQSIQSNMKDIMLHSDVLEDSSNIINSPVEEGLAKGRDTEAVLLGKYIASLSSETSEQPSGSKNSRSGNAPSISSSVRNASFDGFGPSECDGIHISSCGHVVHQECRDRYLLSLKDRFARRTAFERVHVVDPDQEEFLCPVCRSLTNSVIPALPDTCRQMMSSDLGPGSTTGSSSTSGVHFLRLVNALSLLQSAAYMISDDGILKSLSLQRNKKIQPTLEPLFRVLCKMYFPDRCDKFLASGRVSHSMIFWDTLKYSIISTEIATRDRMSDFSAGASTSGIGDLYAEFDSSSRFILSLFLQVVQSTRCDNNLQVLLRFRGIQLFAGSICYGASIGEFPTTIGKQRGNISSVLREADKGVVYPDTQYWRRAADPVLSHDPFSSLMWVLFCLPHPFLSSAESFLSLVHLFYVVCVTQALITCCGHYQLDFLKLEFGECFITDICNIKGSSTFAQQYFVSHYIDSSCHPTDMIRRFSGPYLRRCTLLWKLLKSSTSPPFHDRPRQWDVPLYHVATETTGSTAGVPADLNLVEELEHMFQIPCLEVIFKNKAVLNVSLKWFHHFCEDSEVRNCGLVLRSAPAVPFRLMQLPHIYHDLLQRYIKPKCPECKTPQDDPALCLLCGRLCSQGWKTCCRESSAYIHSLSCGAGIGVFLLIRRTTILLQRSARHAPWPSPYLDAFGEEDFDMHRGKPLYLNEERYAALNHLVASHGLDRSSEILRQTSIEPVFLI